MCTGTHGAKSLGWGWKTGHWEPALISPGETEAQRGTCSGAVGQEPVGRGRWTLPVPFPIRPAPGHSLVPPRPPLPIAVPSTGSASPVSPCPAGRGTAVLVSHSPPNPPCAFSRLGACPAPLPAPIPGSPSTDWAGTGSSGALEAKHCLHLLEKRALRRSSPKFHPPRTPWGPGGSQHPPQGTGEGGPGCQITGKPQPPRAGQELPWEERGNWGFSLVSCFKMHFMARGGEGSGLQLRNSSQGCGGTVGARTDPPCSFWG